MKRINAMLAVAACVAALGLSSGKVAAQGRGNFREQYMARVIEQMDIKDDAEKTAITDAINKVMDARMEIGFGGGMGFRGRRNRGGDNNTTSTDTQSSDNSNRRRAFEPSQEAKDLQQAVDDKAPKAEIKAKLAKLREANVAKEAKLAEAQANLQKLLDSRQEAVAVLNGLLK